MTTTTAANNTKRQLVPDRPAAFVRLEHMLRGIADAIRPPERLTVTQAAQKYVRIKEKNYSGPWSADKTPYVIEPQDMLTSLDYTGMVFVGPARTGKALALDTPIPVPSGWATMGELQVGDRVFDENGDICRVIATTPIMHDHACYRVEFSDGESIIADAEHQWQVGDVHRPDRQHVMTTEQMLPSHRYGKSQRSRYWIDIAGSLDLPEVELPLHPYALGAWLGDGTSDAASITCGASDSGEIAALLSQCGIPVRYGRENTCGAKLLLLSDKRYGGFVAQRSPVSQALLDLNLGYQGAAKHIPAIYLRASREQRIALLQGLMDTDGHADMRGQLEFCTTSPAIAEGFAELLSSLGYKFCLMKRPAAAKIAHRFMFHAAEGDCIFRLERKQQRVEATRGRRKVTNGRRYIIAIVPVDSVPVRCIQVSSASSLYLAGRNMVPTHNSQMFLNWMSTTAICDPADMMLLQMSKPRAREFSLSDLAKLFRNSPDVRSKLVPGRQNDNVYDKAFLSGMRLTIVHPSINELSGKTVGRTWTMDADRIDDNIDGEGDYWTLMGKRGQTLGRYRMNVAESSPGRPVTDATWMPSSPHEAPPCTGILAKYNEGTRARWYWSCLQCQHKFEGDFQLFDYPKEGSPKDRADQVSMPCPSCGYPHKPDDQHALNLGGRWVHEGETWHEDGTVTGERRKSDIISYWLKGPAAAFTTWQELVLKYINAVEDFERTASEETLKSVTNVDLGLPYTPKGIESARLPEELKQRAHAYNVRGEVPPGVRFILTTVDVQAGGRPSFVCHTFGIAPVQTEAGWSIDIYHVDMWKITRSRRTNEHGERELIDPATYKEDWHILIDDVLERTYPLGDGSGRVMRAKLVACDSGGAASTTAARLNKALDGPVVSTTANAYDFWRFLRDDPEGRGYHQRFHLLKGEPSRSAPAIHKTFPDSQQKDRWAIARGDVPVWAVNSNVVKDQTSIMLSRPEPGGMVHHPIWYDEAGNPEDIDWHYKQLTTESRTPKGWINNSRRKNESWDLLAYCVAFLQHPDIRVLQPNFWERPPTWARDWEDNDLVLRVAADGSTEPAKATPKKVSLADLAGRLA